MRRIYFDMSTSFAVANSRGNTGASCSTGSGGGAFRFGEIFSLSLSGPEAEEVVIVWLLVIVGKILDLYLRVFFTCLAFCLVKNYATILNIDKVIYSAYIHYYFLIAKDRHFIKRTD